MTEKEIAWSYKLAINDDSYKDFCDNELLSQGKASVVFKDTVLSRLKLAYQGRKRGNNYLSGCDINTGKFTYISDSEIEGFVKDLIANNDMHAISTRIFSNLALNETPGLSCREGAEECAEQMIEDMEVYEKFDRYIKLLDWSGSYLLKVIQQDGDWSTEAITVQNYFPVFSEYNKENVIGYIEYANAYEMETEEYKTNKDLYRVTEHTRYETNVYFARMSATSSKNPFSKVDSEELYQKFGIETANFKHSDWLVRECNISRQVNHAFGDSNYNFASKSYIRDFVVTATAEQQGLDRVLRPKYIISEDFVHFDKDNPTEPKVNFYNDFFIALTGSEKPFYDQIKQEFNTQGTKDVKEFLEGMAYRSLMFNDTATGTSEKGYNSISGKEIDMVTPVQRATKLFYAVERSISYLMNRIAQEQGLELEISFAMGNPLSTTEAEKIANLRDAKDSGLITHTKAISEYNNVDMKRAEEMKKEIIEEQGVAMGLTFTDDDMGDDAIG